MYEQLLTEGVFFQLRLIRELMGGDMPLSTWVKCCLWVGGIGFQCSQFLTYNETGTKKEGIVFASDAVYLLADLGQKKKKKKQHNSFCSKGETGNLWLLFWFNQDTVSCPTQIF